MTSLVIRNPGADLELRVSILHASNRHIRLYVQRIVCFAKAPPSSIMPSSRIGLLRKRLCYQALGSNTDQLQHAVSAMPSSIAAIMPHVVTYTPALISSKKNWDDARDVAPSSKVRQERVDCRCSLYSKRQRIFDDTYILC